ncbi:hypothetical protein [Pontibacter mangrovi]|uniref:Uncharacterized protein n=1 Tax=Pontibacter mangrovi TaxID=2589816 RepID=A0A501W9G8_9BACT|nr:hypothetical protein [Pontibacter mangrovi]TPE46008.1 hypothetical protein FJM65_01295 [Pontibacter mangrovi]
MTQEEFNSAFNDTLDELLLAMAETPEVDLEKFYSMACIMENLMYFSPVLYAALKPKNTQ